MKKGDVETSGLENFIFLVLHLSLLLGAAAVIFIFIIKPYMFPPLTEPQKDLVRLGDDVQIVVENPIIQHGSPMSANAPYVIYVYPKDSPLLPSDCKGASCICVTELKENQPFQTCRAFPKFTACSVSASAACGTSFCFKEFKRIPILKDQPVTIPISKECNVVSVG